MENLEILAPAGSFDSLTAAVHCGADAVYLGSKSLNARRNAGNFDGEELARAVEFCHIRGVKVYQTLNILLFEHETDEAVEAIQTAARLAIDGVMVQDLGVLSLIRQCAPDLPVFASTQMAVHNLAGALEAKRLGCKRVVLARELSRGEIKTIVDESGLDVEIFVHGALCMSVSGQCYLSSMLGGRSGNRGLCAQPCRLPFSAGKSGYALSLKDLSLVDRVAELGELGVRSLKIEGRMKRPEYVAAAVAALVEARAGRQPDLATLRSVFSRSGFTTGYYDGRADGAMFGIREKEDVAAAAGVLDDLEKLAAKERPRVPLDGKFLARAGAPASLSITDRGGNRVSAAGEPPEPARNKPTDEERVRQSLQKTGGTPFYFDTLEIDLGEGLALPVSQLNALRREALEKLSDLRAMRAPYPFLDRVKRFSPLPISGAAPSLRARCRVSQLSGALLASCSDFILPLGEVAKALEEGLSPERVIAEIPRLLFEGEQAAAKTLSRLKALGVARAWAGNLGGFHLAREAGLEPVGGWSLNVTNSHSVEAVQALGVKELELSFELTLTKARALSPLARCGLVAYGSLPLMVFRNCPVKAAVGCKDCKQQGALTDRKGIRFPVRCRDGAGELFNSVPLYLADRLSELSGFSFLTLWFTGEDAGCCAEIAARYAGASPALLPQEGYTRGLYYRTVL